MGAFEAKVLRNQGVPLQVHKVWRPPVSLPAGITEDILRAANTDLPVSEPERLYDTDEDPVMETRFLRFTLKAMAQLEDRYTSIQAWQDAMEHTPLRALLDTLMACWDLSEEEAALACDETQTDFYCSAVGIAWAVANGVDPTQGVAMMASALASADAAAAARQSMGEKALASLGSRGSGSGEAPST